MKLKQLLEGDYDPASKVLRISGKNSLGKTSSVEIDIPDQNVFFAWLAAVLHEKAATPGGGGKALVADALQFGIGPTPERGMVLSLTLHAGKMRLSFLFPIETTAPERIAAIKGHLGQALSEMGLSAAPPKQ